MFRKQRETSVQTLRKIKAERITLIDRWKNEDKNSGRRGKPDECSAIEMHSLSPGELQAKLRRSTLNHHPPPPSPAQRVAAAALVHTRGIHERE